MHNILPPVFFNIYCGLVKSYDPAIFVHAGSDNTLFGVNYEQLMTWINNGVMIKKHVLSWQLSVFRVTCVFRL